MRTDTPIPFHPQKNNEGATVEQRTPRDQVRALFPLALALLLSLAILLLVAGFRDQIEALKGYGYLGAFLIGFIGNATVILPAPTLAFTVALGGILNPVLVGVVTGAGEALGEMTGYLAGVSGKKIIENQAYYEKVQRQMDRHGGWVFFILAAIPNPVFDIAGIAAGMVRFPVWKFLLSSGVGKTLKATLLAGAGRQFL